MVQLLGRSQKNDGPSLLSASKKLKEAIPNSDYTHRPYCPSTRWSGNKGQACPRSSKISVAASLENWMSVGDADSRRLWWQQTRSAGTGRVKILLSLCWQTNLHMPTLSSELILYDHIRDGKHMEGHG